MLAPKKDSTVTDDRERRRAEVHAWQRAYNMTPRGDSRLTELYAAGHTDWSAEVVARELMATEFIYKHTLYSEVIEEFMRAVASRLRSEYHLTWSATWTIVRFYAPPALKLLCLERSGLAVPAMLPSAVGEVVAENRGAANDRNGMRYF